VLFIKGYKEVFMIKWYENKDENLDKEIVDNFLLREFVCSCGKCKLTAIDSEILTGLGKLRKEFGEAIKINSGFRCQEHNREDVKGAMYSYHCRGMAVDLALPKKLEKKKKFLELAEKYFVVVRVYEDKGFVHCDVGEKRNW